MSNVTLLSTELIGKTFRHYHGGREYTIIDIHQTRSITDGRLISETYITQSFCAGQLVEGPMPWATIKRSVVKHGWV